MKIILDNRITSVAASSSAANYPATDLLNDSPKRIWKADGLSVATLELQITEAIDTIALFNTNAQSATISIIDPNQISWPDFAAWLTVDWVYSDVVAEVEPFLQSNGASALWLDLAKITSGVIVVVILRAEAGAVVQAGICVAGEAVEVGQLLYGLQESIVDFSIAEQLMNGAHYYKSRDRVRNFTVSALPERETKFETFMAQFARTYGLAPKAMHLVPEFGNRWIVYARLSAMPSGTHSYPSRSSYQATIQEVV
jgi:hypothetical protein